MHRLYELSAKLTAARHLVELIGYTNVYGITAEKRVELDARHQLAFEAMQRAERAYTEELAHTDDATLMAIANDLANGGEQVDSAQASSRRDG